MNKKMTEEFASNKKVNAIETEQKKILCRIEELESVKPRKIIRYITRIMGFLIMAFFVYLVTILLIIVTYSDALIFQR